MKKKLELRLIDEFIEDYNALIKQQADFEEKKYKLLERVTDIKQESPDAICFLGKKFIAIEHANAVSQLEMKGMKPKRNIRTPYDSAPVIDEMIRVIKEKSKKDYSAKKISEVWLIFTGITYISADELDKRMRKERLKTNFDRVFLHRGTSFYLLELRYLTKN